MLIDAALSLLIDAAFPLLIELHSHCFHFSTYFSCDLCTIHSQVANRGLCAVAQAESMRYKLLGGLAVRRACYGVLRFVMESGACLELLQQRQTLFCVKNA